MPHPVATHHRSTCRHVALSQAAALLVGWLKERRSVGLSVSIPDPRRLHSDRHKRGIDERRENKSPAIGGGAKSHKSNTRRIQGLADDCGSRMARPSPVLTICRFVSAVTAGCRRIRETDLAAGGLWRQTPQTPATPPGFLCFSEGADKVRAQAGDWLRPEVIRPGGMGGIWISRTRV
jgi:hypothetical protein